MGQKVTDCRRTKRSLDTPHWRWRPCTVRDFLPRRIESQREQHSALLGRRQPIRLPIRRRWLCLNVDRKRSIITELHAATVAKRVAVDGVGNEITVRVVGG